MGVDIFRTIVLGGFVGFAVFCLAYASSVWLKRNKNELARRHPLSAVGPWATGIGAVLMVAALILNQTTRFTGHIDGSDVFISAQGQSDRGPYTAWLEAQSAINFRDLVEVFGAPPRSRDLVRLDTEAREERARLGALSTTPLAIDPALTQRQSQLRAQINQQSQFQFELRQTRRDVQARLAELDQNFSRQEVELVAQQQTAQSTLAGYPERIAVAQRQLTRAADLLKRGVGAEAMLDERRAAYLSLRSEQSSLEATIAGLERQRRATTEQYQAARDLTLSQLEAIEADYRHVAEALAGLNSDIDLVERLIAEDGERAVLATSSGAGFTVAVRVPDRLVTHLRNLDRVLFQPTDGPVHTRFVGRLHDTVALEGEIGRTLVRFDSRLPADVLAHLRTSNEPMTVDLLWKPPVTGSSAMLTGLSLFCVGVLFWSYGRHRETRTRYKTRPFMTVGAPAADVTDKAA